jgi:hypothetical protein
VQGTVCSSTYWKTGPAGVGNNPVLLDSSIFHFLLLWIILQGSSFPIQQQKKLPSNSYHQILRGQKTPRRSIPTDAENTLHVTLYIQNLRQSVI